MPRTSPKHLPTIPKQIVRLLCPHHKQATKWSQIPQQVIHMLPKHPQASPKRFKNEPKHPQQVIQMPPTHPSTVIKMTPGHPQNSIHRFPKHLQHDIQLRRIFIYCTEIIILRRHDRSCAQIMYNVQKSIKIHRTHTYYDQL